ncbi:MAG: ribbon-helix-helix domain-containing protein [Pseudomonadota bacterium]
MAAKSKKKPGGLLAAVQKASKPDSVVETPSADVLTMRAPETKSFDGGDVLAATIDGPPSVQSEALNSKRRKPASAPSRKNTRLIAGHFDPEVARQLRMLAAEEDTTIQELLREALDLLFAKKGKAQITALMQSHR